MVIRLLWEQKNVSSILTSHIDNGAVAEWSKAPVLKTGSAFALVGSNPTCSFQEDRLVGVPLDNSTQLYMSSNGIIDV